MQTASESVPARSSLLPARPRRRRPAKSKYLGRTAGEGKILRWFAIVLVSGKGHGDFMPLCFSLLGRGEQTELMQLRAALELLAPVPHPQLGPAGFQPCPHTGAEEPASPLALPNVELVPRPQAGLALAVQPPGVSGAGGRLGGAAASFVPFRAASQKESVL